MMCSMQKKLESFRKNERYVTKVSTDWEFDSEMAADVIESVGFGSHTHENTVDQAKRWQQFFKDRDEKGLANKIQDEMNWGYKDGVVEIIKSDIDNFDRWYWAEVSGAIEHYFKKNNGYPVPSTYAKTYMPRPIEAECPDGFHYERKMGPEHEMVQKCVFGFPSREAFMKITEEFADYEDFRKKVNNESNGDEQWARYVVGNIEEMFLEYDVNELPPAWAADLRRAVRILRESGNTALADAGETLLETMPVLTVIHVPG